MRNKSFKILVCLLVLFISINLIIQIDNNSNLTSNARKCIWSFSQQIYTFTPGIVNRYNYKYTINVKLNMFPNGRNKTLIALVTSGSGNFERRMAIRKTWANNELFPGLETVFIIGKSVNDTVNAKLINESKMYGDIVQEDYMDTYWNLTIKTVAAMKWARTYTNNTKFFLKVDDDMIVNSYALIPFLEMFEQPVLNTLLCLDNQHSKVDRNQTSKFYMPRKNFSHEYYAPYCNGGAYLLSADLPDYLFKAYHYTPLFLFEDVYVGMLAQKLRTTIISIRNNYCWSNAHCFYALHRHIERTYFFFLNSLTPLQMLNGWLEITEKMMDVISGKQQPEPKFL